MIDPYTDQILKRIALPTEPNGLAKTKDEQQLYALCENNGAQPAKLFSISTNTNETLDSLVFPPNLTPSLLRINASNNRLYFVSSDVYSLDPYLKQAPQRLIANNLNVFYGIDIHTATGEIYLSDAIDYVQASKIYRYDSIGQLIHSFNSGIISNGFVFSK